MKVELPLDGNGTDIRRQSRLRSKFL